MFSKTAMLRAAICLASIVLLFLLGALGDLLPDALTEVRHMADHMPAPTSFVLKNYPLNNGCFLYSLTPWMIFFAGLAFQKRLFLHWFALVWLLALAYCCSYVFAWTIPYYILLMGEGPHDTIAEVIATIVDWVLACGFVLLWLWRWRKKRRSRAASAPRE
jgi:hypothetical protein